MISVRKAAAIAAALIAMPILALAHGSSRQKVTEAIEINAPAEAVWAAVGDFQDMSWLPGVAKTEEGAKPAFAHRKIVLQNGATISESLVKYNADDMTYSYRIDQVDVKVLPVTNYSATLIVLPLDNHKSKVEWRGAFYRGDPNDNPPPELNDDSSIAAVQALYRKGLDGLKSKVEATH